MWKEFRDFFSPYADPFESKVDLFLRNISRKKNKDIVLLMQQNLVVLNMWLECKYRGYKTLSKKKRKKLYEQADHLKSDFLKFSKANDKNGFMQEIMSFLKPGDKYVYKSTAGFFRLFSR